MKPDITQQNLHKDIKELLPWYVTHSLSGREVAMVEQHLADCAPCREELSACRSLADHAPEVSEVWRPSPAHFAGIMSRIDELEAGAGIKPHKAKPKAGLLQRLLASFSKIPRSVQWTLALETAVCFGLLLALANPYRQNVADPRSYQTLSNHEAVLKVNGALLRVMFADELTAGELAGLLKHTDGQIRQGPSAVGNYLLEVPKANASQALAALRANPKIRFVQPIDTGMAP